jgi:hypothetical protein
VSEDEEEAVSSEVGGKGSGVVGGGCGAAEVNGSVSAEKAVYRRRKKRCGRRRKRCRRMRTE